LGGNGLCFPGSTTAPSLVQCTSITASDGAYAALLADGQVVTWGDPRFGSETWLLHTQIRAVNGTLRSCIILYNMIIWTWYGHDMNTWPILIWYKL
jgi:hypothetical protein